MSSKKFMKRFVCLTLSAMLLVLSGAELVQAYSTDAPYLNLTDFKPIAGETTFPYWLWKLQRYSELFGGN